MKHNCSIGKVMLMIGIGSFLITGLVLLGICILSDNESKSLLPIALGCTVIANVLILIRNRIDQKHPKTISGK